MNGRQTPQQATTCRAAVAASAGSRRSDRWIAVAYGVLCHLSFAFAVAAMAASIYTGLAFGRGTLVGPAAIVADAALVLQFPLLHSFLLSRHGRLLLDLLAPARLAEALRTTTYAIIASWQLLLVFVAWSPIGPVWWRAEGTLLFLSSAAFAASWLLLLKTMADASLAVQTGYLGWAAVAHGRAPRFPDFVVRGTFRYVRQPIYIAFTLTLWTAPTWTTDRLLLALAWTAYCLIGPRWKEARYLGFHGDSYARYRESVPYWLPRLHATDTAAAAGAHDVVAVSDGMESE